MDMDIVDIVNEAKTKYHELSINMDNILNYYYNGYLSIEEYFKIITTCIDKLNILVEKLQYINDNILKNKLKSECNEIKDLIKLINEKISSIPTNAAELELVTNIYKTKDTLKNILNNPIFININSEEVVKQYNISDAELINYFKIVFEKDCELKNLRDSIFLKLNLSISNETEKLKKKINKEIIEYKDRIFDKKFDGILYAGGLFFTVTHLIATKYYGVELVHPLLSRAIPIVFLVALVIVILQVNSYTTKINELEEEKKKLL